MKLLFFLMFLIKNFFANEHRIRDLTTTKKNLHGRQPLLFFELTAYKLAIMALLIIFFIAFYFLKQQIQQLTVIIKHLSMTIQSIESAQLYLKNQLILKDAQIKALENLLIELHFSFSALSTPINNMPQNFELLRQEIVEINQKEQIKFLEAATGVLIGIFFICFIQHSYKSAIFHEAFNVSLLDSEKSLVWDIKITDNKIAEILVNDFDNPGNYWVLEGPARVLTMKCSDTITSESIENLEITKLIGSYLPITEKTVLATQISEIISSFFGFFY